MIHFKRHFKLFTFGFKKHYELQQKIDICNILFHIIITDHLFYMISHLLLLYINYRVYQSVKVHKFLLHMYFMLPILPTSDVNRSPRNEYQLAPQLFHQRLI